MKTLLVVGTAAFGLCLVAAVVSAQEEQSPRDLAALQKHIVEKDYPELFGSTAYRTKIEKILNVDLDRDGNRELVVLFAPHYRQSAPIVIYRLSKTLEVTRVKEGLAPGPLVPLSGAYLDSHSLGQGVDFTLNAKDVPIGLLRKEVHVEKLPVDFVRFAPGTNPILLYETSSRAVQPLRFPPH